MMYGKLINGISIHALRGEGDDKHTGLRTYPCHFNPRPPWGGRRRVSPFSQGLYYFNPRPPWGGRLYWVLTNCNGMDISIHALRGEGDVFVGYFACQKFIISIHALRGEGDGFGFFFWWCFCCYFNPRPPWGGRLALIFNQIKRVAFQSTPSVGRATISKCH